MRSRLLAAATTALLVSTLWRPATTVRADGTAQSLPFSQNWSNIGLITANDSWTGVPGIEGCRGDALTSGTAVNPQTIVAANDPCVIDVNANLNNPNGFTTGGVTEFELADPVVALQGSGTARAPYLRISLNTTAKSGIRVRYTLHDIDGSADNAVQPVALQYRIGASGDFTNVAAAFVADASTGPNFATAVTPVNVILPAAVDNQALVQLRILTTDAAGSDEWIGVDNISIDVSTAPTEPVGIGGSSLTSVPQGTSTLLTVRVIPGDNPASTGIAVAADLTSIGGSAAQAFLDNGLNGDAVAGDGTFSYQAAIGFAVTPGAKAIPVAITDAQARSGSAAIGFTVTAVAQPLTISEIQGTGTASPYAGQLARTTGIVTGRISNGYFIQRADPGDGNSATSDGIFVFTSSAPPVTAAVGSLVEVTGSVAEFRRSAFSPSVTELTSPVTVVQTTGNPLPAAVAITSAELSPSGGLAQLERFEGMRVSFASLTAVAPTDGSVSEANASSTSNGFFSAVLTGTPRAFREPGVQVGDPDPNPAPGIPRFDGNPEVIGVASGSQPDTLRSDVATGAVIANVTGPLHQDFGQYRIQPDATLSPVGGQTLAPVPAAGDDALHIASFNLQRFFDTANDPATNDPVLSAEALARRLNKASLAIRNVLGTPDVVAVIEVENLAVLQTLAAKINADAVADSQPDPGYQACLFEGNDIGGIDSGFLYQTPRVELIDCVQFRKDATYINPENGLPETLHDRPPVVLRGTVTAPGSVSAYPFTVVVNHLRSLTGVDDPADGNRVRVKRRAQAEDTATLLQGRQGENTISVGDYNAFQFSDGFVHSMGTMKGDPAPASQVYLASADLVEPNYINLVEHISLAGGYSFIFNGSAQSLDHALINQRVAPRVSNYAVARVNADFPEVLRNDETRPEKLSDHDPLSIYIKLPVDITGSTALTPTPVNYNAGQGYYMGNLQVTNSSSEPLPNPFYVVIEGLDPSVTLLNATGVTPEGWPYIAVARNLKANASEVVQLRFGAPVNTVITYTARVLQSL